MYSDMLRFGTALGLVATLGNLIAEDAPAPLLGDVITVDDALVTDAATRRRRRIETAPQPVIVLDAKDLVSTPASTLPDRLRYEPGVEVYQYRYGQHDVGMRGYNTVSNSRVLVQFDGLDMRWEGLGTTQWSGSYNMTELDEVTIAKGPSSVMYGANAFGGAIQLRSRQAGDQHELITQVSVSDPYRVETDATALGPIGESFDYKFTVGFTKLDDLPGTVGATDYQANPRTANSGDLDLESYRYAGELGWHITDSVRLSGGYRNTTFNQWEVVDDYDVGSNSTDWAFNTGYLRLTSPIGEIFYAQQWADYFYSNQKATYDPAQDFRYTQAGFEDRRDTLRAQSPLTLQDHYLVVGTEFVTYETTSNLWAAGGTASDSDSWATVSTDNIAVFAEDQWAVAPHWSLTGGLRIDDHSRVGTNASPRLGVNYVPSHDEFVLVSVSSGYRVPNFIESDIQEYYFASDPDLDVERIVALEVEWSRRLPDQGTTFALNGFANRSNDLIWAMPLDGATMQANYNAWLATGPDLTQQPGPFFQFANVDNPAMVYGTEMSLRQALGDSPVTLWTNATWQNFSYRDGVRYQSAGYNNTGAGVPNVFIMDTTLPKDVNGPPTWKANLGLDVQDHGFFASGVLRYVGERTIFSFANSTFPDGDLSVTTVDDYLALDMMVGWEFANPGTKTCYVRFGVMDLFNTAHQEWHHATATELANANEQQLVSDIGRQLTLEGRWTF